MSSEHRRAARRIAYDTGAGAGIGRACARRFAQGGWQVAISDVDASTLVPLRAELGAACIFDTALDVADADAVNTAFQRFAQASGGQLHLLLNNAGVLEMGAFEALPQERQRRITHINNDGVLNCSHRAFPLLAATPGARVVNLSSASANYGVPSLAVYSASKFWVRGFTEALNLEWERHGIWVCDVMPNFVGTGMLSEHGKDALIGRLGVKLGPEDVAEVVWRAATGARRVHWPVEKNPVLRALVAINGALPQGLQRLAMKVTTGS
jgi:NAD(P)-dependent dehydrogenase (short-subunit alcohol dehydrogenase family)